MPFWAWLFGQDRARDQRPPLPRPGRSMGARRVKRSDLLFPADRVATTPPEMRGLARDEVRLLVSRPGRHEHARFRDLARLPAARRRSSSSTAAPRCRRACPRPAVIGNFTLNLSTRYGDRLWLAEPRWDFARPGPLPRQRRRVVRGGRPRRPVRCPLSRLAAPVVRRLRRQRRDGDGARGRADPLRLPRAALTRRSPPTRRSSPRCSAAPRCRRPPGPSRGASSTISIAPASRIAAIELHAGVSSLETDGCRGRAAMYPEPFHVPAETAAAVNAARRRRPPGHRGRHDRRPRPRIGLGRRARESGTRLHPALRQSAARRAHRRRPDHRPPRPARHPPRHAPRHRRRAISSRAAYAEAVREGYLWHEFGDSHLILPERRAKAFPEPRLARHLPLPLEHLPEKWRTAHWRIRSIDAGKR